VRGILLDLDNTLLDDRYATEQGFHAFVSVYGPNRADKGLNTELVRWKAILDRNWERFEKGEISFLEQRRCRVREFSGQELDDAVADTMYDAYQRGYESAWRLLPGVPEFLNQTIDIPKVIITNGQREAQIRKLRATMLESHIVGLITPDDCGQWKPSAVIFEAALSLLEVPASECLMIGDDPVRDIEPARQLGMRCFHTSPGRNLLEAIE
jgi:putative hydrolase of the HAD superfamily